MFNPSDTPAVTSPLRIDVWTALLLDYPDAIYVETVVGVLRHGAKLGYDGPLFAESRPASGVPNLPMGSDDVVHVRETIAQRIAGGQAKKCLPSESVICSPIGTVPKSNGKLRTINHLLWPRKKGNSVNAGIHIDKVSMRYEMLDGLFEEIRSRPDEELWLWKGDLKDAYYHIPVACTDSSLLGFHFDGETFRDCTLNFGGRSSPYIFNFFAEGLHWMLANLGLTVYHYLDDFFGVAPRKLVATVLQLFRSVCLSLGFGVSNNKTMCGPRLEVLGIYVDTATSRAWITQARIEKLSADIDRELSCDASHDGIRSLAGSLVFVSRVCPTGRAFLGRLYDGLSMELKPRGVDKWPKDLRADLVWWRKMLATWNGILILRHPSQTAEIWTDAATSGGLGAHLGPKLGCTAAFAWTIPTTDVGQPIMFLETLALWRALEKWAFWVRGHRVVCKIDNTVLVAALRSGSVRHARTQTLIRKIFSIALSNDLTLAPEWIPSSENCVADALSRFDTTFLQTNYPAVLSLCNIPVLTRSPPIMEPAPEPPVDDNFDVRILPNIIAMDTDQ